MDCSTTSYSPTEEPAVVRIISVFSKPILIFFATLFKLSGVTPKSRDTPPPSCTTLEMIWLLVFIIFAVGPLISFGLSVSSSPVGIIATLGFLNTGTLKILTIANNATSCPLITFPLCNKTDFFRTSLPKGETKDPIGREARIPTLSFDRCVDSIGTTVSAPLGK
jgi:hypothetical protein